MARTRKVMTAKQKRFAEEYVKCRVLYTAAIKAGYSKNFANSGQAGKLLDNQQIGDYMDRLITKMDMESIATQEEILVGLTKVFRRQETEDVVTSDKDGNVTVTEARNSVADAMKAGTELMKIVGRTTQSKIEMARLKKLQAEAMLAENKLENGDSSEVTINITPID